ncbi:MAG: hypothetical protein CMG74_06875 [Candidatus Marinimicrobia bacterium]|nr:hypothetical protein [Candidatus Neomarinimicrobiota bacterium]
MNKLLNLFFLIVFSIFLFYWFQNIIKKKKKYLYIPYSSILDIRNEVVEDEEVVEDQEVVENIEPIIYRNNIFENWDNYL